MGVDRDRIRRSPLMPVSTLVARMQVSWFKCEWVESLKGQGRSSIMG
jgi:hypothetical protein